MTTVPTSNLAQPQKHVLTVNGSRSFNDAISGHPPIITAATLALLSPILLMVTVLLVVSLLTLLGSYS